MADTDARQSRSRRRANDSNDNTVEEQHGVVLTTDKQVPRAVATNDSQQKQKRKNGEESVVVLLPATRGEDGGALSNDTLVRGQIDPSRSLKPTGGNSKRHKHISGMGRLQIGVAKSTRVNDNCAVSNTGAGSTGETMQQDDDDSVNSKDGHGGVSNTATPSTLTACSSYMANSTGSRGVVSIEDMEKLQDEVKKLKEERSQMDHLLKGDPKFTHMLKKDLQLDSKVKACIKEKVFPRIKFVTCTEEIESVRATFLKHFRMAPDSEKARVFWATYGNKNVPEVINQARSNAQTSAQKVCKGACWYRDMIRPLPASSTY